MKKFLALILVIACLLPAAAMAETVVTSFYPIWLFARCLLEHCDGVEVHCLTEPTTGCLHDYQLSTSDMKSLSAADVFLINGAGMESFLTMVTEAFPALPVVDASAGIDLLPDESGETEWNAHVWLDAGNAQIMVSNMAEGLIAALPAYADTIAADRDAYLLRLRQLDEELRASLADLPSKQIVTFHEAFPYFARAYGLEVVAVVALDPEDSLSPRRLAELVTKVDALGDPPLFTEPQYASLAAETVSAETGAPIWQLDPCVTGPEDAPLTYYEDVMRSDRDILVQALSR